MSGKIAKNIGKATKSLKSAVNEYNAQRALLPQEMNLPMEITWSQTTDQQSVLWQSSAVNSLSHSIGIPPSVRQEAIQKYFLQLRCKEEIALIKEEMHRVAAHTHERIEKLVESLPTMYTSVLRLGTACLIKRRIIELIHSSDSFTDKFSPFITVPSLPPETSAKISADFGELHSEEENSCSNESDTDEELCISQDLSPLSDVELSDSSDDNSDDEH